MTPANARSALEIIKVTKNYHGLRPLRVDRLVLAGSERIAVSGLDAPAAEVLVGLVTGAAVPDQGEVRVYGRPTTEIAADTEWLTWLDQFGIVSHRAVLLDGSSIAQNLALSLTLEIDPLSEDVLARVGALAGEAGLEVSSLGVPAGGLSAAQRMRIHLGRALALDPTLLLLEHPTVGFGKGEGRAFGDVVARVAKSRSLPVLVISDDAELSGAVAERRFALDPATGTLRAERRWFRS